MNGTVGTIIRAWTPDYESVAKATRQGVNAWRAHNNLFLSEVHLLNSSVHASWSKIDLVIEVLEDEPDLPVIWMDVDIDVISPKMHFSVMVPTDGIFFSADTNGLCAGFFVARGPSALSILHMVKILGPTGKIPDKQEQDSFKVLHKEFPKIKDHMGWLACLMGNPEWSMMERETCWAYHYWANMWHDKEELARQIRQDQENRKAKTP